MKSFLIIVISALFGISLSAQCDTSIIPETNYSLVKTSSKNGANGGELTFDSNPNSRWRSKGAGPHEITIDLGMTYNITGFSIYTRWEGTGRVSSYELFVTNDTTSWGDAEKMDVASYPNTKRNDSIFFGGVNGRYAKLVCTSTSGDIQLSELRFFKDTCMSSGKKNQAIDFPPISKKTTTNPAFSLNASVKSGQSISYSIVSGPATVSGNTLTLTKNAGTVKVKAIVAASASYYPNDRTIEFIVIDLANYNPKITTRLTEDFPIEILDTSVWYPIYINASIDEPSFLSINDVKVEIDGKEYPTTIKKNFYYYAWKPEEYKVHDVKIIATGSNGKTTTVSKSINVVKGASNQSVSSLKDVVIEFGKTNSRNYYGTYKLPQHVGTYNKLNAHLKVQCPNGNCDDWDRWAYFDIKAPDGNWIQIIRYITPYNVGCDHSIDLTDYASLLQGEIEFHVFIDTWGTGGWQLTLDFDYTAGKPSFIYSSIEEVWDATYDFGNPSNLQPVPDRTIQIPDGAEGAKLILSSTGHGWGAANTGNAAEFYHAKHDIMLNSGKVYEQDLWNKCNPNPDNCTGQQGTWTIDRAGWCPGAISPPNKYDFSSTVVNSSLTLGYKFQASYEDKCHPKSTTCISGVTCTNCNEGFNPHYQVDGHFVAYSNSRLFYQDPENNVGLNEYVNQDKSYELNVYPNPNRGLFKISAPNIDGDMDVAIYSVDGIQHKRYYFQTVSDFENNEFNLTGLPAGIYFIEVRTAGGLGSQRIVLD